MHRISGLSAPHIYDSARIGDVQSKAVPSLLTCKEDSGISVLDRTKAL